MLTHIVAAEAAWYSVAVLFDLEVSTGAFVAAAVGGIAPDLDYPDSAVGRQVRGASRWIERHTGHRGMLHSLLCLLALTLILFVSHRATGHFSWWIAASVGYASHLFSDMLTLGGVQLFWPNRVWCIFPGRDEYRIISGSPRERTYLVFCCILAALMWPLASVGLAGMIYSMGEGEASVARIVSVSDGDTLKVEIDGSEETIRLIGVDTPETVHPSEPVGCFGPEASKFTKSELKPGQEVNVLLSAMGDKQDAYGRMLAYVFTTPSATEIGTSHNYHLIEGGYARTTTFPHERSRDFEDAEEKAKARGLGLWSRC